MTKRYYNRKTAAFIAIAVFIMVGLDFVLAPPVKKTPVAHEDRVPVIAEQAIVQEPVVLGKDPVSEKPSFAPAMSFSAPEPVLPEIENLQTWKKNAVASDVSKDKPRIALIIDDMGLDIKHTRQAMDLPGPLTMSFMPYAQNLSEQTAYAISKGHELMLHMPMEPENQKLNAGPKVLKVSLTPEQAIETINADLDSFHGYVGVNNHMGSKMTQDRPGMARLMTVLKERGLLFVDSKTIGSSVAADEARKANIPYAVRHVFIDDDEKDAAIAGSLEKTEQYALKHGFAVAIAHPRKETVAMLQSWLPTLKEKGIELVPVSSIVTLPVPDTATEAP